MIPDKGAQTAFNALASVDEKLAAAKLDLNGGVHQRLCQESQCQVPQRLNHERGAALQGVPAPSPTSTTRASATPQFRDVNLTVGAGEFVSVVGPTGCGKSTLLNVGAGLLAPSTGSV
jgi:ABC-type glutathione transport system ATPase component